jgi:hypothetical protein
LPANGAKSIGRRHLGPSRRAQRIIRRRDGLDRPIAHRASRHAGPQNYADVDPWTIGGLTRPSL